MPQSYELHIISVSGIHWKPDLLSLHRETPNLYVAIDVDGELAGLWNDLAPLSAESPSSVITLEVFSRRSMKKDKCMAKTKMEIGVLLEKCSTQKGKKPFADFRVQLDHVKENVKEKPELVVRMTAIGRAEAGAIALANATQDSATLTGGAARSTIKLVDHGGEHADLASALKTLVARLDIIVQMGAELAKV
ncbi:hypothetical protein FB451DRAFT_1261810 [Mycena latifolia]|nr:hypothetical protein FB451DRAFT_1261810 [Mycena latifolia]